MNYQVVTDMVHAKLCLHIFSHKAQDATAKFFILNALDRIFAVIDSAEILRMLNKKLNVGSNPIFSHSCIDRMSGRIDETILSKLSNSFFADLPAANLLFTESLATIPGPQDFARQVEEWRKNYRSPLYSTAWINFYTTTLCEVLSTASTAMRNIRRHKSDIALLNSPKYPRPCFAILFGVS